MTMKNMFHGHELPEQEMTTLNFRGLPKWFQRQDLVDLLHGRGFKDAWDCAYLTSAFLPRLFADVNFISHKAAFDAQNVLDGCDRFAYQEGDVVKQVIRVELRTESGKADMIRAYAHARPSSFFMLLTCWSKK